MLFFILHTLFIMSMTILIVSTFCFNISSKSISISTHGFCGFGDNATFKNVQISLLTHSYSPWSSKILMNWNRPKKFMQVRVDVKCVHTDYGGCGLSGFGDKISLWSIVVEKFNRSESAQKIHASRD